ncbi:MAG TPA: DUF732 domain-containing protein [Pseudonocardiaceae bacterium]|jgi:hypothetical protein|nr:DUF732 domain-containing protein [Pseudonocardiaceae bacterium]
MFTLAIVLGSVGALLILVGLIGGDFTFSGSAIPKVGKVSRVLSFTVGGFLVLSALSIVVLDSSNSNQTSANPAALQPLSHQSSISDSSTNFRSADNEGTSPYSPTDQNVVSLLSERPSFRQVPGADLVSISHAECGVLQRGGHGSDVVAIMTNNGASAADASYGLGVAVAAYCPDYLSAASQ